MDRYLKNWIITLFATAGTRAFLLNSINGILKCGIDPKCVHVFFPKNAEAELLRVVEGANAQAHFMEDALGDPRDARFPESYLEYNTPEFNRLMRTRFPVIRSLVQEYEAIVYADIDVAWLANPLPYLSEVLARYPMAFQTEAWPQFPPVFCTGFFALRSCPESLALIDLHISQFTEDCSFTQQGLFNTIIQQNPHFLSHIFPLPEAIFANGLLHAAVAGRETNPGDLVSLIQPFIFHANFTVGSQNKKRLLKLAGCWQSED